MATARHKVGREQRRAALERHLFEATVRLMKDGTAYTELTVDQLAAEAGVSRATFYVYFQDKGELLCLFAAHVFEELADGARLWWDVAERQNPADARLAMSSIVESYRRHQALLEAVIEMAAYDADVSRAYQSLLDDIVASVEAIIRRGQRAGSIRPLPARATAAALTWMVERSCHQTLRNSDTEHDADLALVLTETVWNTLYLRSASDS